MPGRGLFEHCGKAGLANEALAVRRDAQLATNPWLLVLCRCELLLLRIWSEWPGILGEMDTHNRILTQTLNTCAKGVEPPRKTLGDRMDGPD